MSESLTQAINDMRTMRESYDQLGAAAEAYNVGKTELAQNITAKGVEASASETLPELAEKVSAIAQDSYTIDGGEMYAKQLYGSLTAPNYWNLYEVLANLLSDGRLVSYGGILLAEYYKGYDSLALAGAGAGGAYVVSDMENGVFKMYTADTTHIWNTQDDCKGNRWVAYCFADESHDFDITDTNTCPRTIHIGRHVGTIRSLVAGRISQIVVTDGNKLDSFTGNTTQQWDKHVILRNIGHNTDTANSPIIKTGTSDKIESIYLEIDNVSDTTGSETNIIDPSHQSIGSIIIKSNSEDFGINCVRQSKLIGPIYSASFSYILVTGMKTLRIGILGRYNAAANSMAIIEAEKILLNPNGGESYFIGAPINKVYLPYLEEWYPTRSLANTNSWLQYLYIGYKTNDRTISIDIDTVYKKKCSALTDIELKDGYKKNLNVSYITEVLTAENIALHMLAKLADNTGEETLTLTIGATNLARIMADETYAPYVAAAQAKNWTIS